MPNLDMFYPRLSMGKLSNSTATLLLLLPLFLLFSLISIGTIEAGHTDQHDNKLHGTQEGYGDLLAGRSASIPLGALKKFLLRIELDGCCPPWDELTRQAEIQEEQKKLFGKSRARQLMRAEDLMNELTQVFVNITHYSIDGQVGQSEWEKYYKFYDNVQYYLRLVKVSEGYLAIGQNKSSNDSTAIVQSNAVVGQGKTKQDKTTKQNEEPPEERDFKRQFKRQLVSIQFRVSQDPIISSFIDEHNRQQELFENYETFIRYTQFGQHYAQNISMVRQSVQVLGLIGSHLEALSFPSNLTRPSKVYEMMRGMSRELFRIKYELLERVSGRVLDQRLDVRRALRDMDNLIASRPDIRMLGDEFGLQEDNNNNNNNNDSAQKTHLKTAGSMIDFSANVRKLTHLLDLYTTDNMTHLSFYNQLSALPEEFILLGFVVAHEYESKELPQHISGRFINSGHYTGEYSARMTDENSSSSNGNSSEVHPKKGGNSGATDAARSHHSNRTLLSRLIFG